MEKCRNNLSSCLERNAKLCKEIADLNALLKNQNAAVHDHDGGIEVIKVTGSYYMKQLWYMNKLL